MSWATTTYAPGDAPYTLVETFVPELAGVPAFAVEVSDDNGRHWATNGLRWTNAEDARNWASGLALRWFGCTNIRTVATDEEGNPNGTVIEDVL